MLWPLLWGGGEGWEEGWGGGGGGVLEDLEGNEEGQGKGYTPESGWMPRWAACRGQAQELL
jgi:hypothetical protein